MKAVNDIVCAGWIIGESTEDITKHWMYFVR